MQQVTFPIAMVKEHSHRHITEWVTLFADRILASSVLERLARQMEIEAESCRGVIKFHTDRINPKDRQEGSENKDSYSSPHTKGRGGGCQNLLLLLMNQDTPQFVRKSKILIIEDADMFDLS